MNCWDSITNYFKDQIKFCAFPLLLGLSGGPDSIALFHLLKRLGEPFEVAHIDHGWRERSSEEAAYLRELCLQFEVPFHLKSLEQPEKRVNLEERGRKARLAFFKEVCERRRLSGVALAHHADDQAETVLKRFFEGASLPKLKGLLPKTQIDGLAIYRPLLKLKKKLLVQGLEGEHIPYFLDETNHDPRFLRTRLREQLIPTLSHQFGKQVGASLCHVGEAAAELEEFLETLLTPYRALIAQTPEGVALDLSKTIPETPFLLKAVLRDFFEGNKLTLSRSVLETLIWHLREGSCHCVIQIGKKKVRIHRRCLIVLIH